MIDTSTLYLFQWWSPDEGQAIVVTAHELTHHKEEDGSITANFYIIESGERLLVTTVRTAKPFKISQYEIPHANTSLPNKRTH